MLQLKDVSVDPTGLKIEMVLGLVIAETIFSAHGHDTVVTSINDGRHSAKSRHYIGFAVDLRSKHIHPPDVKDQILDKLKAGLPGYDVLLEGLGTPNEHYHLEYDPRRV